MASSGFRPPTRRRVGSGLTMVDAIGHHPASSSSSSSSRGGPHGSHHKHAGKPHGGGGSGAGSKSSSSSGGGGGGFWAGVSSLLGGGGDSSAAALQRQQQAQAQQVHTQGLYMYGGVGVGKTMLMDVFVETATHDMKVREPTRGGNPNPERRQDPTAPPHHPTS